MPEATRPRVNALIDQYVEAGQPIIKKRALKRKSPRTIRNETYCFGPLRVFFGGKDRSSSRWQIAINTMCGVTPAAMSRGSSYAENRPPARLEAATAPWILILSCFGTSLNLPCAAAS